MLPFRTALFSSTELFVPFRLYTGSSCWRGRAEEKKGAPPAWTVFLSWAFLKLQTHCLARLRCGEEQCMEGHQADWAAGGQCWVESCTRPRAMQQAPLGLASPGAAKDTWSQETGEAWVGRRRWEPGQWVLLSASEVASSALADRRGAENSTGGCIYP